MPGDKFGFVIFQCSSFNNYSGAVIPHVGLPLHIGIPSSQQPQIDRCTLWLIIMVSIPMTVVGHLVYQHLNRYDYIVALQYDLSDLNYGE